VLPDVPAGAIVKIDIPGLQYVTHDNSEWWVTLSLCTASASLWASSGHEIAWSQFSINSTASYELLDSPKAVNYSTFKENSSDLHLSNTDFVFEFDKSTAQITKWCVRGNNLLDGTNGLTFWRAPTDNDIPHDAEVWTLFGLDCMQQQVRSVQSDFDATGVLKIVVQSWVAPPVLAWGFDTVTTYTVHGDGEIRVHTHAVPRGPSPKALPRFGLDIGLSKRLNKVKWFGRGPGESYNDKKEAARIGVWASSVDDMMTNYEFPQENGNRTDTRWVDLTDEKGSGLRAILNCEKPSRETGFDFNVQRFSSHELQQAKHPHELGKSDKVLLRIDGGHHGLGTASCGPGVLEQHQLSCQVLDFTVYLMAIQS
jgi:beta-galactosidase